MTLFELTTAEIERIFALTKELKEKWSAGFRDQILPGRVMALLFEKPSLRTRVSFEASMAQLGGASLFLGPDVGWGNRESTADFGQVLSQYVDVVVCRTAAHSRLEELSKYCNCPVINGLTDYAHPCQALADLYTLEEMRGPIRGKRLAYIGDANNVANSLAIACARLGVEFSIATPKGYEFKPDFLAALAQDSPDFKLLQTNDPAEAVKDAIGVYTDVWASMGQESEQATRAPLFAPYQVNEALMEKAPSNSIFLHCLPAHRGEEVTDEVIDGYHSAVIVQAGNRMHVQKGLIAWLLKERTP
jgi:ornithine carbamoyltransferase